MTTTLVDAAHSAEVFYLDIQLETEQVRHPSMACSTDDGCGQTCQISACHSQK